MTTTKDKPEMKKLSGIALWAHVQEPKPAKVLDEGGTIESTYTVSVVVDDKTAEALTKAGYKVKEVKANDNIPKELHGKPMLEVKNKPQFTLKDGTVVDVNIAVVDAYKQPTDVLIGNGSKINVAFEPVKYKAFGGGISPRLKAVQIIDLVEFTKGAGAGTELFDEEEGFTAGVSTEEAEEEGEDLPF